ncbi:MAG: hypothetical protein ABIK61_00025 [candidate division WOR-3 bacterium]
MLIIFYLWAIFEYQEIGGSSSALQISSTIKSTYNATAINPALLSNLNKNGIGLVYCRPFEISDLQYSRLSINYKNFGVGFSRLGFINYQEFNLSLSAGFNLLPNLAYGLIIKGLYIDLNTYGQSLMPALNLGTSYVMIDKIIISAVMDNLNMPQNPNGEQIPWQLTGGVLFQPVPDFCLGCDLTKSQDNQNIKLGTEFKVIPELAFRLGMKTNPLIISGGLGITFRNIYFDYSLQFYTQLKQTSIFSLGYFW